MFIIWKSDWYMCFVDVLVKVILYIIDFIRRIEFRSSLIKIFLLKIGII